MDERINSTPKILMISNQPTVTGSLTHFSLQQKYNIVLESVAANALERWAEVQPDLIVLDINFPKDLILQLIRMLREETFTPIILLTRGMVEDDLLEIYEAGADDCLMKPISPSVFLAKIRVWLRRSMTTPANVLDPLKVGNIRLLPSERTVVIGKDTPVRLTNLELRLLYMLMSRPRHILPAEELIEAVWSGLGPGDSAMLKNLIYRLRRKIETNPSNPITIQTAPGQGYMFIPQ